MTKRKIKVKNDDMFISVIVPVFNEEKNVAKLHQEILSVLEKISQKFEIIFIDDGSIDNTLLQLKTLKPVKIIQFRKNFGQTAALEAGIKAAKNKILITLDGDGQNDPKDIPKLLKKLGSYDCICGWRYSRKDSFLKKFVSAGAAFLEKIIIQPKIHDLGCTLKVFKKECFADIQLYGEMHRMIPPLLEWQGFTVGEVKINHRPRKYGKSKYNWNRIIKGFLDMVNVWFWKKYSARPLHLFGGIGLFLVFCGAIIIFLLAIARIFFDYPLSNKIWPLVGFFSFLTGVQFLVFGILADILVKNLYQEKNTYNIKEVRENSS